MTLNQHRYGFGTPVRLGFDEAIRTTTGFLQDEGFGVLTTIDLQRTLQEKIGVDRGRYVILGACNPRLANRALDAEPEIGLLLPCNVIVYEHEGRTTVSFMDAAAALGFVGNAALDPVGAEAGERLRRVATRLAALA
jgi:uncharacterized protein (DUF302 family)